MVNQFKLETMDEKLAHLASLKKIPSINPRSYDKTDGYSRMDYIDHDEFGIGFVEEVLDRYTMKVFFPCGEKTLPQRTFK